jgi:hypothetical protein
MTQTELKACRWAERIGTMFRSSAMLTSTYIVVSCLRQKTLPAACLPTR